ncbi:LOW QUALITY PROTEIN: hypothetical protein YC2023_110583 [Brassica napus]
MATLVAAYEPYTYSLPPLPSYSPSPKNTTLLRYCYIHNFLLPPYYFPSRKIDYKSPPILYIYSFSPTPPYSFPSTKINYTSSLALYVYGSSPPSYYLLSP